MIDLIIAPLAFAEIVDDIGSVVIIFGYDVDYAGDGVIPVGGAAAVLQDFDTVNRR
jgi:hypothetical protein